MAGKTPPKRDEAPPKLRPRFLRPLFPFLSPHEKILKQIGASLNVRDAGGSEQQQLGVAEEMKAVKDKGHVLVKAGKSMLRRSSDHGCSPSKRRSAAVSARRCGCCDGRRHG